jgi:uncharacterized FlgJ-related protein
MHKDLKFIFAFMFLAWLVVLFVFIYKAVECRQQMQELDKLEKEQIDLLNDEFKFKKVKDFDSINISSERRTFYEHLSEQKL